jgi:hypothetical protein
LGIAADAAARCGPAAPDETVGDDVDDMVRHTSRVNRSNAIHSVR